MGSAVTSEVLVADANDPDAAFTAVLPRREGVEYTVEHAVIDGREVFLILHNDGAVNFTLVEAPVADPQAQRTLIPARDDVRLEGVDAFARHLVVHSRQEALPRLELWPIDGGYGQLTEIAFDSERTRSQEHHRRAQGAGGLARPLFEVGEKGAVTREGGAEERDDQEILRGCRDRSEGDEGREQP